MINKKGASLSGWTEGALGIILIMLCIGVIVTYMNVSYGKNYDATFGLNANGSLQPFKDYQATLQSGMQGEASTSAINGISLATSWQMIKAGLTMSFDFITGGWIENLVGLLPLGTAGYYLGLTLRLLFIFSIGFILIKLLFKVKA